MTEEKKHLFEFCLRLGDNSLILGHRLSEWCGHGPALEEDIAMTNVALDLIGQSRMYYQYAVAVEGAGRTEDDLAYLRTSEAFCNALLVEQPNGDFDDTTTRQFLFDAFNYCLLEKLQNSADQQIAAIAEKSLKEVTYHLRRSADWMCRLGDGTEESHQRMQVSLDKLWMYTQDLFATTPGDEVLLNQGIGIDMLAVQQQWELKVGEVLKTATLKMPQGQWMMEGSRKGIHTEHLGFLLAEMQHLQRAYPGAKW